MATMGTIPLNLLIILQARVVFPESLPVPAIISNWGSFMAEKTDQK
jgi:hypothetical protein